MTTRPTLLVAVAAVLLLAGPAAAGPQDVANEVARTIMSPFCPGLTLHDCPSQAALDLRARIAEWAEDGMSKQAILDRLEAEYGPGIHAAPATEGAGLVAWILPAIAVVAGAAAAWVLVRRWSAARGEAPPGTDGFTDADRARLESELQAMRESR